MNKVIRFLAEPILDQEGKLSIGRILLVVAFISALVLGFNISNNHLTLLLALLGYVIGGRVSDSVTVAMDKKKSVISGVKSLDTSDVEPPAEMRGDN
jgi:uncharacterized membrane-anchored protein YitT (DUF2179 family)